MPRLLVYLVRHGETNENSQNIIQGQLNTQLNENGRHQIRLLAEGLKSYAFAYAYSSDLDRAVEVRTAWLCCVSRPMDSAAVRPLKPFLFTILI